jgi:hypothetical protein
MTTEVILVSPSLSATKFLDVANSTKTIPHLSQFIPNSASNRDSRSFTLDFTPLWQVSALTTFDVDTWKVRALKPSSSRFDWNMYQLFFGALVIIDNALDTDCPPSPIRSDLTKVRIVTAKLSHNVELTDVEIVEIGEVLSQIRADLNSPSAKGEQRYLMHITMDLSLAHQTRIQPAPGRKRKLSVYPSILYGESIYVSSD